MRVLIADDDPNIRRGLSAQMLSDGFDAVSCGTGEEALEVLSGGSAPPIAVLDWMMPGLTGPEVCQRVRGAELISQPYIIVLTVKTQSSDVTVALDAGANDYMTKPFSMAELRARIRVGKQVSELQARLSESDEECQALLQKLDELRRLLPVCISCRKLRNEESYWKEIEEYLRESPGDTPVGAVCAECAEKGKTSEAEREE